MKQTFLKLTLLRALTVVAFFMGAGNAWGSDVTDVLSQTWTGVTGTSYTNWTGKKATSSAVYAGNSAGGNESIQLRSSNSNSGVVTTTSGGKAKKVTVVWNNNTASGRTLNVYGKNSAYTAATELYNTKNQGTLLGTIVCGTSTELTISDDYEYIGFRSDSGAMYLTSVSIVWEAGGSTVEACATPTFSLAENYYKGTQNVTISCETEGTTIYYTTDGSTPTTSSTSGTTATISESCTLKAIAVKDGFTNSGVASAAYAIVANAGTEAEPFTVADARKVLNTFPAKTFDNVYVSGIISQIDSYSSQYSSITYWISDDGTTTDQFEVYSGKGLNGADFSAETDLTVGNSVVVKGTIKKYNSTFEFDHSSQIVSMEEVTHPVINAENALELEYNATSGSIEYTITNPTEGKTLTATSNADWISNITVSAGTVTFTTTANDGTTNRTGIITLAYEGAESVTVTVTQKFFVADYATLPFEFNGGLSDIGTTAGLSQNGLGSDYSSAPKLKFDGTGDYVVLKFNERPGTLTFDIKGNGFSGGTFKVQTSADGETYTDLETYTEITGTQNEEFKNLGENVRYIKWIYTNKSSGNVGLGSITLAQYSETPAENPTVNVGTLTNVEIHSMWIGDNDLTDIEDGSEVEPGTEVFVKFTVAEGYTLTRVTVLDANNDEVTVTENSGNYSFHMPNSSVTINATATESSVTPVTGDKYVKVTSDEDLTSGQYLIVYEDGSLAFNGGLEALDAVGNTIEVVLNNSKIAVTDDTEAAEFTIDVTAGTIKNASGNYIGQTSNANGLASNTETAYTNTLSIDNDGNANIVSSGGAYLRYNATSGQDRFRYFKSSTYSSQKAIQLYKKVEAEQPITVTVGSALYTTYVTPAAVSFPEGVTAYIVTAINESSISMEEVTTVPAKTPIVVEAAEAGTYTLTKVDNAAVSGNKLLASDGTVKGDGSTIYALGVGKTGDVAGKVGFYPVKSGAKVPAGKAYLKTGASSVKEFLAFDFGGADGVNEIANDELRMTNIFNLAGQRLQKLQKGVNIVGGKKVLVK